MFKITVFLSMILFFLSSLCFAQGPEDSITITTYYPSPYGVYKTLRLFPGDRSTPCQEGEVFYDDGIASGETPGLYYCDGSLSWQLLGGGGYWAASGDVIYNTNTGNVGIGTGSTPLSPLHVAHPSRWMTLRLSRLGNGSDLKHRFIGVWSDGSLVFGKTDDAHMTANIHMAIDTDGNVSVRTQNPLAKFDVRNTHSKGFTYPLDWFFQAASFEATNPLALRIGIKTDATVANRYGAIEVDEGGIKRHLVLQPTAGNVGIGTTAPGYKLEVVGDVGADAYYYRSDIALKENINPLKNTLERITQLSSVSFNWKETGEGSIGLIAQEVEEIFPEVVATRNNSKSIDYAKLIAPLIEAVKEQQVQIEKLKAKIDQLGIKN